MRPQDALPGGASTEWPPVGNGPQEAMACPRRLRREGARVFAIFPFFDVFEFFGLGRAGPMAKHKPQPIESEISFFRWNFGDALVKVGARLRP